MSERTPRPRRPERIARALAVVTAALLSIASLLAIAPPASAAAQTVVSLTFDDGDANQLSALPALNANGMKATFFVVSGYVGAPGYFSRSDLDGLKAAGHEIGGHTVNHPDLTTLSSDEDKRQICTDRNTLTSWGFSVRSFAYPFASSNKAAQQAAKACGYNSARMLGDLQSRFGCAGCASAEKLPPSTPYATKALDQVDATWTLADLQQGVLNAEKTGGWVQYTFHDVCDNACSELAISPGLLSQFLSWLKPRASTNNTVVRTVGDTIGGSVKPTVTPPAVAPAAAGKNGVSNPSLETVGSDGTPTCWMKGGWGTNTPTFSLGSPAHTGSKASTITMTGYSSGDAKLLPQFDLGQCSPSVTVGHTYSLRSWYQSSAVTQFAVYLRSTTGSWVYWTSSPWFAASSSYAQAVWTSPAIPSGYTAMSFALSSFTNGTLITDDLELYDTVGAPAVAPVAVAATPGPQSADPAPTPTGTTEVFTPMEGDATQ